MSLVFAGVTSHGPGITARPETADPVTRDAFFASLHTQTHRQTTRDRI